MFDKRQDNKHVKKLLEIKLRSNQYLPQENKYLINSVPHKKLSKSRSQFLNLANKIQSNRKHLNSVDKSLKKQKPVDYYDEGKYLYERDIERVKELLRNNLKNKNDILENELKSLKKKMVKIPLYKLNGMRNTKISKLKLFNSSETNEEDGENNDQEKEPRYSDISDINNYSKENQKKGKKKVGGIKHKIKYINKKEQDED